MSSPKVSVVLPVFNGQDTLAKALYSLRSQSMQSMEIIVVDDGSTDRTPRILHLFSRLDDRIIPVYSRHKGIVEALNQGIKRARGKYIARMDCDDICLPQRMRLQSDYLDTHPEIGLAASRVGFLGDRQGAKGYAMYVQWTNSLLEPREIAGKRFVESPLAHPSVMFRRSLVEQFGGYRPGPFPEDYELWLRWMEQGVSMAKLDRMLLLWRDNPSRLSRTHPRYSVDAFYEMKITYLARWLERHNPRHPDIILWGAGRTTRKRAAILEQKGVCITKYIDINPRKIDKTIQGKPVIGTDRIPGPGRAFIVPMVGKRGAREDIAGILTRTGHQEGVHYIFGA